MTGSTGRVLFWTPRIMGVLFVVFLSLFAADAFAENQGPWQNLIGLAMHLIPASILVVVLAISGPLVVLAVLFEMSGRASHG